MTKIYLGLFVVLLMGQESISMEVENYDTKKRPFEEAFPTTIRRKEVANPYKIPKIEIAEINAEEWFFEDEQDINEGLPFTNVYPQATTRPNSPINAPSFQCQTPFLPVFRTSFMQTKNMMLYPSYFDEFLCPKGCIYPPHW